MKTWTRISCKIWIALLLVSFSLAGKSLAQSADSAVLLAGNALRAGEFQKAAGICEQLGKLEFPEQERQRKLILGQSYFGLEKWNDADSNFVACTENQFAKGMIHALMEENANIRPRHVKGAIFISKLIPGMAYVYVREPGKAIANFALIGGLAVSFAIFWPLGAQLAIFGIFDWALQGAKRAEQVIIEGTEGKRARILKRILELTNEV